MGNDVQGDMFRPSVGRGAVPTSNTPGRRGSQFVGDPITAADELARRHLTQQLERIALEVGADVDRLAGAFSLWVVRARAVERGILTGTEGAPDDRGRNANPRALSWLGALLPGMARRGLLEKFTIDGRPQYDTSGADRAHGNKNILWRLTPEGRTAADSNANRNL